MSKFSRISIKARFLAWISRVAQLGRNDRYVELLTLRQIQLAARVKKRPESLYERRQRQLMAEEAKRSQFDHKVIAGDSFPKFLDDLIKSPVAAIQIVGELEKLVHRENGNGIFTLAMEARPTRTGYGRKFTFSNLTGRCQGFAQDQRKIMDAKFGLDSTMLAMMMEEFINHQESKGYKLGVNETHYFNLFCQMVGEIETLTYEDIFNFRVIMTPYAKGNAPTLTFSAQVCRDGVIFDSLPIMAIGFEKRRKRKNTESNT